MTRDDIIRMARDAAKNAKDVVMENGDDLVLLFLDELERFAALVAAAERERIKEANAPEIEKINAHIKALEDAVVAEREACAKVCEENANDSYEGDWDSACINCADHIRARGKK